MAIRPGQIRYLTEGKLIGAKSHKGFVATFNWMLSWIYNFKPGPGLKLEGERAGKPRLSLTLLNEDGAPIDDGGEDTPYPISEGGGGTTIPGPFTPVYTEVEDEETEETHTVLSGLRNCYYCAERYFHHLNDQTLSVNEDTTGYIVLTITHPATVADIGFATASVAIETDLPSNDDGTVTKIPLYHLTNGAIDVDLRAIPTAVLAR